MKYKEGEFVVVRDDCDKLNIPDWEWDVFYNDILGKVVEIEEVVPSSQCYHVVYEGRRYALKDIEIADIPDRQLSFVGNIEELL